MYVGILEAFFERLQDCSDRNIGLRNMWNFEEMRSIVGRGGGGKKNELVISRVRVETPRRMQQGIRGWVTLVECVSAVGIRLPGFYIYAWAAHYKGWHSSEAIAPRAAFSYTNNR